MIKLFMCLLLVVFCSLAYSQPVVSSSNFPSHGRSLNYYMGNSSLEINKNGGENQQWDFSKMGLTDFHSMNYVNSKETKYISDFPTSSIAFGPEATGDFTYLNITEKKVEYLGFGTSDSIPVICKYDNSWIMYALPLHFRDKFSDSFSSTSILFENGDTLHYFFRGEYTYTVDGFGTLITPHNTYPNTLRIHSVITGRDSCIRTGATDTVLVNTYVTNKYSWISFDNNHVFEEACTFDFKDFFFQDSENKTTDIVKNSTTDKRIMLFPDPANSYINLEVSGFETGPVSVFLYNSFGSFIKKYEINQSKPGFLQWQMPVNELMPGFYSIRIMNKASEWNAKFVKQ